MSDITQEDRIIGIDTPLGPDVLLLRSFTGVETMSRLFRFHLDMLSRDFNISFDDIIGKKVTLRVELADGSERYFNGYINRFSQLPVEEHLAHYEAEMVPWLWFLTRPADCRIFQDKSIPDIIEKVFSDYGFSDYKLQLQRRYQPRTYCVQYRETAANFVMRLMEEEGIFYYFKHDNGSHKMIIGDTPGAHEPGAESDVRYEHTLGEGAARDESVVYEWRYQQELRPGKYALNDYNFETPSTDLMAKIDSVIDQGGNKKYEVYDYPGEYLKRARGDSLVRLRMEEEETPHIVTAGASDCGSFSPGFRFTLNEHERDDQNREYVLTTVTHSAHSGSFTGGAEGEGGVYANKFTCIPYSVPFRPPRLSPKSRRSVRSSAVGIVVSHPALHHCSRAKTMSSSVKDSGASLSTSGFCSQLTSPPPLSILDASSHSPCSTYPRYSAMTARDRSRSWIGNSSENSPTSKPSPIGVSDQNSHTSISPVGPS